MVILLNCDVIWVYMIREICPKLILIWNCVKTLHNSCTIEWYVKKFQVRRDRQSFHKCLIVVWVGWNVAHRSNTKKRDVTWFQYEMSFRRVCDTAHGPSKQINKLSSEKMYFAYYSFCEVITMTDRFDKLLTRHFWYEINAVYHSATAKLVSMKKIFSQYRSQHSNHLWYFLTDCL